MNLENYAIVLAPNFLRAELVLSGDSLELMTFQKHSNSFMRKLMEYYASTPRHVRTQILQRVQPQSATMSGSFMRNAPTKRQTNTQLLGSKLSAPPRNAMLARGTSRSAMNMLRRDMATIQPQRF